MLKVLFAASEATPLAKVGGLGDVAGALPKALHKLGVDIRLVIPKYKVIETPAKLPGSDVPVYYVESKEYFDRDKIYGYEDDPKRFAYFSQGVLEMAKNVGFEPDVIHVNDYHTSLVPVLLKTVFSKEPFFAQSKTVLTLHNLSNQGVYDPGILETVGLRGDSTPNLGEDTRDGDVDLLLQGISEADLIVAVSPTYAKEILTPEFGEGLEGKLNERQERLYGVLNGIDTDSYNPETDSNLESHYSPDKLAFRARNKAALSRELNFPNPNYPIFGLITRLVSQKGLDLLLEKPDEIMKLPLNLAVLGVGDPKYEDGLKALTGKYKNLNLTLQFNEGLARRIYAGSDFFLVPSRFEPCGLTQMVAMRYGSIPIARKTGGLADTVFDGKNGLVFETYSADKLFDKIEAALEVFKDPKILERLRLAGMRQDFSWDKSAKEYVKLYEKVGAG